MSYTHYTPPPGTHPPPTSTTYPYGTPYAPHGAYAQTPGAYSYQPQAYQTGVTGYGWPYPYATYVPHAQQMHAQRPATQTPAPVTAHAPTTAPTPILQRTTTFTSYTPSYLRESVAAASTGGAAARGSRKQSNVKGLFTKDCEPESFDIIHGRILTPCLSEESHVWFWR